MIPLIPPIVGNVGVNLSMVRLLADAPSIAALHSHWYGVGARHITTEQANSILTEYAANAALPMCRQWEKPALAMARVWLSGGTDLVANQGNRDPLQRLLLARSRECEGKVEETSHLLQSPSQSSPLIGPVIGPLLRQDKRPEAEELLKSHLCGHKEPWCAGYVGTLLDVWYGTMNPSIDDGDTLTDTAAGDWVPLLPWASEVTASPGVRMEHKNPLIVSGLSASPNGDNYIAFPPLALPDSAREINFEIRGEILGTRNESCLALRLVFTRQGDYLMESSQPTTVNARFTENYRRSIPAGATEVTPRITFAENCFTAGQQIAIYYYQVEVLEAR